MRSNRSEDLLFFRDHYDFGRKIENERSNRSEDLFFRDHHEFGKNKGNTRSKLFFLENINFCESLLRGPILNIRHWPKHQKYSLIFVYSIADYWNLVCFCSART